VAIRTRKVQEPGQSLGGKQEALGGIEDDQVRQNDGDSVGYGEGRCRMDSTTSGARRDSKRVETDSLAEDGTGQRWRHNRDMTDVHRPSNPHPNDHR